MKKCHYQRSLYYCYSYRNEQKMVAMTNPTRTVESYEAKCIIMDYVHGIYKYINKYWHIKFNHLISTHAPNYGIMCLVCTPYAMFTVCPLNSSYI